MLVTLAQRWLHALKIKSWPKLLAPMVLGQALGVADASGVTFGRVALAAGVGLAFTLLDAILIVLLNDWGDQEVDAIKRRRFPDAGSPKTIPDGILPADHVLLGGLVAAAALLVLGFRGGEAMGRPLLGAVATLAAGMFVVYTFPPASLNYRGGGELVEAVGVGLVLPQANAYLQSGQLASPRMLALGPALVFLAASSAIASGLSDEESDREGGKRTFATWLGNPTSRRLLETCVGIGFTMLALSPALPGGPGVWVVLPPLAVLAWHARRLPGLGEAARTNRFAEQAVYKDVLHRGLWGAQVALAVTLLVAKVVGSR